MEGATHQKIFFHTRPYRPNVLGSSLGTNAKDYNGQTYWLSVNLHSFIKAPKWLNLAIGYGGRNVNWERAK
jgi:hypothetical protein